VWAVRALVRFVAQLAIAVVIGLVLAVLIALAPGGSFRHSVEVGFFGPAALLILAGLALIGVGIVLSG